MWTGHVYTGKVAAKRLAMDFTPRVISYHTKVCTPTKLVYSAINPDPLLSRNVVSLPEVLSDKRSRGAFGEVQLNALIRNVLPAGREEGRK
jgi:hypothetical protein